MTVIKLLRIVLAQPDLTGHILPDQGFLRQIDRR